VESSLGGEGAPPPTNASIDLGPLHTRRVKVAAGGFQGVRTFLLAETTTPYHLSGFVADEYLRQDSAVLKMSAPLSNTDMFPLFQRYQVKLV
jgi:hypothetical protein